MTNDDSPSIVPNLDHEVYLVLDDFGKLSRAYRETDENEAAKRPRSAASLGIIIDHLVGSAGSQTAVCKDVLWPGQDAAVRDILRVQVSCEEYVNFSLERP
jgi:hypothetical protein